ncbi:MAG: dihydrolipoyl dehydrogenase [Carboxydocellales bacterium]
MAKQLIILGGGPGGYVAAIRAAQLGAQVTVVEKDTLGGTCLNRGCIPTKALAASAEYLAKLKHADEFGIKLEGYSINLAQMLERKNKVVAKLVSGIHLLFKKHKIQLITGAGRLISPTLVEIAKADGSKQTITGDAIILATGSEPATIAALGYDGEKVYSSNEALQLKEIPQRLLIIGGGVIGCEFACIFHELGAQVTIVEVLPSILPLQDQDVTRLMQSLFKRRGIDIKTKAQVREVHKTEEQVVVVVLENGEELTADQVLISIGRRLNTQNLGLAEAGIKLGERGEVLVNEQLQTNLPHIYAIGDITNKIQLAHVASFQGIVAVEHIMGKPSLINYGVIPNCVYTIPEVAGVGITTQAAKEQGLEVATAKFPFIANGKAMAMGEAEGFVKMLAEPQTGKILGVHIVGPRATDLIAEAALAMEQGLTVEQLAGTVHAHPTLAEALMEAAEAITGKAINI